jgi:hypothetical protein
MWNWEKRDNKNKNKGRTTIVEVMTLDCLLLFPARNYFILFVFFLEKKNRHSIFAYYFTFYTRLSIKHMLLFIRTIWFPWQKRWPFPPSFSSTPLALAFSMRFILHVCAAELNRT